MFCFVLVLGFGVGGLMMMARDGGGGVGGRMCGRLTLTPRPLPRLALCNHQPGFDKVRPSLEQYEKEQVRPSLSPSLPPHTFTSISDWHWTDPTPPLVLVPLSLQPLQKTFAVNKHESLPEEERAVVREAWGDYFDFYGYEK